MKITLNTIIMIAAITAMPIASAATESTTPAATEQPPQENIQQLREKDMLEMNATSQDKVKRMKELQEKAAQESTAPSHAN